MDASHLIQQNCYRTYRRDDLLVKALATTDVSAITERLLLHKLMHFALVYNTCVATCGPHEPLECGERLKEEEEEIKDEEENYKCT